MCKVRVLMIPSLHHLSVDTNLSELNEDLMIEIVKQAAGVYDSIAYAETVFANTNRFYHEDGPVAIKRLCESLNAMIVWTQTLRLTETLAAAFFAIMTSIVASLRRFLGLLSFWEITDIQNMTAAEVIAKITSMCNQLEELQRQTIQPPTLSRQRAKRFDETMGDYNVTM